LKMQETFKMKDSDRLKLLIYIIIILIIAWVILMMYSCEGENYKPQSPEPQTIEIDYWVIPHENAMLKIYYSDTSGIMETDSIFKMAGMDWHKKTLVYPGQMIFLIIAAPDTADCWIEIWAGNKEIYQKYHNLFTWFEYKMQL